MSRTLSPPRFGVARRAPRFFFFGVLVSTIALSLACNLIFPYRDVPDGGPVGGDGPVVDGPRQDVRRADGKTVDRGAPTDIGACPAPGDLMRMAVHDAKFTVAVAKDTKITPVIFFDAKTNEGALVLDQLDEAAGFIYAVASTGSVDQAALKVVEVVRDYADKQGGAVRLLSSGQFRTSHDGHPTIAGMRLSLTLPGAATPPAVRTALFPGLVGRPSAKVSSWAAVPYNRAKTKSLVVAVSVLLRDKDGRVLVMGAVADAARVASSAADTATILDDLSDGTGVGKADQQVETVCTAWTLDGRAPTADIIWVIDESGSMTQHIKSLAAESSGVASALGTYRLNYRMGVTGMESPDDTTKAPAGGWGGKLCTQGGTLNNDHGGEDRFLSPAESTTLQSCLRDPPGTSPSIEYGLANAYLAVTRHLPRKDNDKARLRRGAAVAVVVVTDEAPGIIKSGGAWNGLSGWMSGSPLKSCALTTSESQKVQGQLKVFDELFGGQHSTWKEDGRAVLHTFTGVCFEKCSWPMDVGWGYQQLAGSTGGVSASLCQDDLSTSLRLVVENIAGHASPLRLKQEAISASLKVKLGTSWLSRSRAAGFGVFAPARTVVLTGKDFHKNTRVVATYRRWK